MEGVVVPDSPHFSGLVFKLQANMDPRHRDKVAFVRVVSGKFEKGMKVNTMILHGCSCYVGADYAGVLPTSIWHSQMC